LGDRPLQRFIGMAGSLADAVVKPLSPDQLVELKATGAAVCRDFENMLLSGVANDSLERYFCYGLGQVNALGFRLEGLAPDAGCPLFAELYALTDLILLGIGPERLPDELNLYPAYTRRVVAGLEGAVGVILDALDSKLIDPALAECLSGYLKHMRGAGLLLQVTLKDLFYFRDLVRLLSPLTGHPEAERETFLREQLIRCDFNHLGFLYYLQTRERQELGRLTPEERLARLRDTPAPPLVLPQGSRRYDRSWPGLQTMLAGWRQALAEEWTTVTEVSAAAVETPSIPKIALNLSVAHLACLLRVLQEEGLLTLSLSDLFKTAAGHFRTRRQETISAGSLSKEYYSTSQFTAARVRDLLLKLAKRITVRYFPVMAAVYCLAHAG